MKIKMRPDEADASSTSELTTMGGWLAELREQDDQGEPDSGGSAGTDSRGHDETESHSGTGMAIRSHTGTGNQPAAGTGNQPAAGTDHRPATGTGYPPSTGMDTRRSTGTGSRASTWTGNRPYTWAGNRAYTGPDGRPSTGTNNRPSTGTDGRSHVQPAGETGSRAMASPAAPPNTYAPRRWAGARATVNARPETFPVRALIGDELRMPTAWCEMGSCISWHADRAALGEADNRARAISAGWRIDALGRMTCPRCQQTSASFRATRPVVPWDRATAITMAARATARPGYRNTGSVPRPNGRGTRRPASGQR